MSTINPSHLRLLAIFAMVVESKSFAAAARRLGSSRSRISEQITQLEQALGVRLLQRTTRQLTMTSDGQQVYEEAQKLALILQNVEGAITPQQPMGRVSITMTHDIAHRYVLPVLAEFQKLYPKVKLDLHLNDERVDLIAEQIDLAIRVGLPRDESLIARVMHEERFAIMASTDYLSQHGMPENEKELEQSQWIKLSQMGDPAILRLKKGDELIELHTPSYHKCNSPLMAQQMAVKGLGLAVLLPSTVREYLECGELLPVMPELTTDPIVFSLVYPSRKQIPLRCRVLIDFLLAAKMFH